VGAGNPVHLGDKSYSLAKGLATVISLSERVAQTLFENE